jgi:hypothetical protein
MPLIVHWPGKDRDQWLLPALLARRKRGGTLHDEAIVDLPHVGLKTENVRPFSTF